MSTIKVNYKSDLPPMSVELTLGGEVQQIPAHDFVLRFFTVYPHRHYDCVFEDGVWKNMEKVDDTHLNVYITNHGLGVGQLHCLYISKAPYEGYDPAYYTTYSLTGMDVELIDGNGDATDGIDAEIAIDIEGVLADCRAATAAALEITALMQEIYDRLVDFYPDNYYTKTESDARFHPLYGKRTLNMNADNMYLNRLNMINADGGADAYLTNHTSRGNKILVGNGRKVTVLPWPTDDETWTVALTKDHYSKSATDSLLGAKQDTLVSGTNIKTVGGESLLPSSSTNTNVKPQYIFEATVTDGVVTCSETWESLWEMIFTKGKSVAAKVGTRIYTLHNTSGVTIVFKNLSENTIRTLTCGSMSSPTWSFSSRNLQDELVSGTNIKTINGNNLLGEGNINIGGSGLVFVHVTGPVTNLSADKTFSEVVGLLNEGSEVVYVYSGVYYRVTSYDVNHISAVVVDGEYIRYLTHTSTEHVGTLLLGVIGDALMDTIDDLLAAKQDKSMLVTVTENSGVFMADKTFAEVDAALSSGKDVRFFDGVNYFDVTGYIATQAVIASYTTGSTNEKFTYTPSDLTWERTYLAPKDSPALTGTPTAPTPAASDNSTKIATTAYVKSVLPSDIQPNDILITAMQNSLTDEWYLDMSYEELSGMMDDDIQLDYVLEWTHPDTSDIMKARLAGFDITYNVGGTDYDAIKFSTSAGDYTYTFTLYNDGDKDVVVYEKVSNITQVVEVAGASPTQTLAPNTFYQFTGAVTSLTLTLGTPIDGIANIYAFSFVAGADNPTISLPASVTIDGTPSIAQGDYVEFSIMNNVAIFKVVTI